MKLTYSKPVAEIEEFALVDFITTSGNENINVPDLDDPGISGNENSEVDDL